MVYWNYKLWFLKPMNHNFNCSWKFCLSSSYLNSGSLTWDINHSLRYQQTAAAPFVILYHNFASSLIQCNKHNLSMASWTKTSIPIQNRNSFNLIIAIGRLMPQPWIFNKLVVKPKGILMYNFYMASTWPLYWQALSFPSNHGSSSRQR